MTEFTFEKGLWSHSSRVTRMQPCWALWSTSERRLHGRAGNDGEAGAGPAMGLPKAISGVNSYSMRGYGSPAPQTVIVIGYQKEYIEPYNKRCELAGKIPHPYHQQNEESKVADTFVCRRIKQTWAEFWRRSAILGKCFCHCFPGVQRFTARCALECH